MPALRHIDVDWRLCCKGTPGVRVMFLTLARSDIWSPFGKCGSTLSLSVTDVGIGRLRSFVAFALAYGGASPDDEHLAADIVTIDGDIVEGLPSWPTASTTAMAAEEAQADLNKVDQLGSNSPPPCCGSRPPRPPGVPQLVVVLPRLI
jgi:hypothetical protein